MLLDMTGNPIKPKVENGAVLPISGSIMNDVSELLKRYVPDKAGEAPMFFLCYPQEVEQPNAPPDAKPASKTCYCTNVTAEGLIGILPDVLKGLRREAKKERKRRARHGTAGGGQ